MKLNIDKRCFSALLVLLVLFLGFSLLELQYVSILIFHLLSHEIFPR
jgi:hypothetical protein